MTKYREDQTHGPWVGERPEETRCLTPCLDHMQGTGPVCIMIMLGFMGLVAGAIVVLGLKNPQIHSETECEVDGVTMYPGSNVTDTAACGLDVTSVHCNTTHIINITTVLQCENYTVSENITCFVHDDCVENSPAYVGTDPDPTPWETPAQADMIIIVVCILCLLIGLTGLKLFRRSLLRVPQFRRLPY